LRGWVRQSGSHEGSWSSNIVDGGRCGNLVAEPASVV